ncbi:G-type lectin S-receptor-like serine/threonine-protein kinase At5g35370 [Vicia villosa]|uniref:G-type lectin S-receptor-like serine/threonine-protein kinase At5g35370 n=1 Tax=Vicia villosa TaxID=3911 RepID=UPI00273AA3DE|nr:G-type lectin S-receptor-like serine/threonine-protein kinase At5g35370 [Vicia villosa]
MSQFCFSTNYHTMKYIMFFSLIFLLFATSVSAYTFSDHISPNFTASYLQFISNTGTFLFSRNKTFKAAIFNPGNQQTSFYLCIIHSASNTIIWSANRDAPISDSDKVNLTAKGITIYGENGKSKWSTPSLKSHVQKLQLTEMGNLVLLGQSNESLWESFDHPTDTIVIGQRLSVGSSLSSASSSSNWSTGNYVLTVSSSDAILQWYGQTYWKLSRDSKAYKSSSDDVEYMAVNTTGFYLFGHDETVHVYEVGLSVTSFRFAKLAFNGQFTVSSFSGTNLKQEFVGPDDGCQIPLACGRIGLCNDNTLSSSSSSSSSSPVCSCPSNFHGVSGNLGGCVPNDGSRSLPLACSNSSTNNHSQSNSSGVSFLSIGYGVRYFANVYSDPFMYGVNLSVCEAFCSSNCSCLGILYRNSSGSCYMIENELGSISNGGEVDMLGLIKANEVLVDIDDDEQNSSKDGFPVIAAVLLPSGGMILLLVFGFFLLWRKFIKSKKQEVVLGKQVSISRSSGDLDSDPFCIPGLPTRFDYEELEVATENFKTLIGSGAFGVVYKGVLPDKTIVAVKKIINIGIQGKKDFFAEIAVIGNIHHVNLVRLKGFCAQRGHRMLVYEYMNRGSLDRNLFGGSGQPVLEWQERLDVALGTARGLAYLHSGCESKIIHCDIKPENILLHDQFQAKISDFGLSKLLSPEQSGLFTTMRGTRGYLAPEWLTNSAISEKTDVYSFGMVLLELISGRKNCSFRSRSHSMDDEHNNSSSNNGNSSSSSTTELAYFPLLALEMHEQKSYMDLADPRLEGRVTFDEVEKLVRIALCCVHEDPVLRPNMVSIVGMLEGGTPLPQPRMESLNFLRFYGRRFSEASVIAEENERGSVRIQQPRDSTRLVSENSYISSQQISGPR